MLVDDLIREWRRTRGAVPFYPSMTFVDRGVALGSGTAIARFVRYTGPKPNRDLEGEEGRILALLAAAYDRAISGYAVATIKRAGELWEAGEKSLAQIRLAFLRLPLIDERGAFRLDHAADLLDKGFSPSLLLKEIGFPNVLRNLEKFDPDQPRVPAGSGRTSGRWTSGNDLGTAAASGSSSRHKILVQRVDINIVGAIRSDANPDSLVPGAQYAQTAPPLTITQDRLDHISKFHWFNSTVPDKGRFTAEYSNDEKIRELIDDAWQQLTPNDVALAGFGNIVIAGAVFLENTETHEKIPLIIGTSATGRLGAPAILTNAYVVILTNELKMLTCYPINPLDKIHPQNDAR